MASVAVAIMLIAGCAPPVPRQSAPPDVPVAAPALPSDFTIAAGELETWNAVGQLLVRLPGVAYQGRSQKLGLYAVDYRGESFLILTRALVASAAVRTLTTEVRVALPNGTADSSPGATELLATLQSRLPDELIRIAALPKAPRASTKAIATKGTSKRKSRR